MVMELRMMCRDGCEWVRVFEALVEDWEIKIVAGAKLITCSNSDDREASVYIL
jgi:hypothetical protein